MLRIDAALETRSGCADPCEGSRCRCKDPDGALRDPDGDLRPFGLAPLPMVLPRECLLGPGEPITPLFSFRRPLMCTACGCCLCVVLESTNLELEARVAGDVETVEIVDAGIEADGAAKVNLVLLASCRTGLALSLAFEGLLPKLPAKSMKCKGAALPCWPAE